MLALKSAVAPAVEVSDHAVMPPIAIVPAPKPEGAALRWWMLILAGLLVFVVRSAVMLTAMPSFSSREDMDKLCEWQVEQKLEQQDQRRSLVDGAFIRITNPWCANSNYGGGHRVNIALCILAGAIVPASYVSIKVFAALVAAVTLMAFLWALRRTIMPTTALLFAVVFLFPPIRVFTQSGLFVGAHVEAVLFIALMIGFGLRALESTTRWRREAGFAGVGIVTSLGLYYYQGMWLWLACFFPALLFGLMVTKRPFAEWLTGGLSFFLGLLPGVLIIVAAYWPENMMMLLPYQRGTDDYPWELQKLSPARIVSLIEELLLPFRVFSHDGEEMLARIGGAVWWVPIAAALMIRVRRRNLHLVVWPILVYIVMFTAVASITLMDAPRHRTPMAMLALLLQCLVLCELAPEFVSSFVKRGRRREIGRDLVHVGMLIGFALVVPRAHEDLAIGGRHSLREGLAYDGAVVTTLGVDGIEPAYARAVEPRLAELAAMSLSSEERRLVLNGMGLVFSWGEALSTDFSLPKSVTGDVTSAAMRRQAAAFLDEGWHEQEIEQDFAEVDTGDYWYRCGVDMALAALDELP